MKSFLLTMLALALIVSSSCKKEECQPGNLNANIIGSWTFNAPGLNTADIEFLADGTMTDPYDALISTDDGGISLNYKSWSSGSNTVFTVRAANQVGTIAYSLDYNVTSYTCDKIVFIKAGIEATLTRK